jgi:hypothetical protein
MSVHIAGIEYWNCKHGWCAINKGYRNCSSHNCGVCGFNLAEIERRKELIRKNGFTEVNGIRRLRIPRRVEL